MKDHNHIFWQLDWYKHSSPSTKEFDGWAIQGLFKFKLTIKLMDGSQTGVYQHLPYFMLVVIAHQQTFYVRIYPYKTYIFYCCDIGYLQVGRHLAVAIVRKHWRLFLYNVAIRIGNICTSEMIDSKRLLPMDNICPSNQVYWAVVMVMWSACLPSTPAIRVRSLQFFCKNCAWNEWK